MKGKIMQGICFFDVDGTLLPKGIRKIIRGIKMRIESPFFLQKGIINISKKISVDKNNL